MHFRNPVHGMEIFFPILNFHPQTFRIHHIVISNILYRFRRFFTNAAFVSNFSNFFKDYFNIVSFTDDSCYVVLILIIISFSDVQ